MLRVSLLPCAKLPLSQVLDNDNKYRCDGCKALVCAEKRLAMSTAPELRA